VSVRRRESEESSERERTFMMRSGRIMPMPVMPMPAFAVPYAAPTAAVRGEVGQRVAMRGRRWRGRERKRDALEKTICRVERAERVPESVLHSRASPSRERGELERSELMRTRWARGGGGGDGRTDCTADAGKAEEGGIRRTQLGGHDCS